MAALRRRRPRGAAGFTLVELLISLILLALAMALAAQLLVESQQMFVDTAAESADAPAPLAIARLRGDVVTASSAAVVPSWTGKGERLVLSGHPAGEVSYEQEGSALVRRVGGAAGGEAAGVLLHRVGSFHAAPVAGTELLFVELRYLAHAPRRSPLPNAPGTRGPTEVWRTESLFLLPRGKP
jgi:prepilin-type N-terminal cleavage/methylation domain-containing protein